MNVRQLLALLLFGLIAAVSIAAQEEQPAEGDAPVELTEEQVTALLARVEALESQIEQIEADVLETRTAVDARTATVTGESRLVFTWDGLTSGTAFENDNEIFITVPLARGTEVGRYRGDGMTAQVSLYGFNVSATEDGTQVTEGKIDAELSFGDYYVNISQTPEFLLDLAAPVASRPENVRTNAVIAEGGMSVGRQARGSALEFRVGSYSDDARENFNNRYGFGLSWEQRLIPQLLNIEAGASYGAQLGYVRDSETGFTSRDLGWSIKPILLLQGIGEGIRVNLASDFLLPYDAISDDYGDLAYDASLRTEFFLSEEAALPGGTRDRSRLSVALYSVPDEQILDIESRLIELRGDAGFLPVAGGDLTVILIDVLQEQEVELGAGVQTTFGSVTPGARTTYRTTTERVGLNLSLEIEPVENVQFLVEYASTEINDTDEDLNDNGTDGDIGEIKFTTVISY